MLKIRIPFGFKTVNLDSLYIFYTGKIRVSASYEFIVSKLFNVEGLMFSVSKRGYVIISYVSTDFNKHLNNIKEINVVLREIMIERIDRKYCNNTTTISNDNSDSIIERELPF